MNIPYVFKVCTKCGKPKVANTNYFYKGKEGKYGLRSMCKDCKKEYNKGYRKNNKEYYKEYRENNKEHIREYNKEYRENNKEYYKEYFKEYGKEYYENNKEYYYEYNKEYRKNNKEHIEEYFKEYGKEYRKNNKEHIEDYQREYYKNNKERIRDYYENNKERIKEQHKEYRATPQGQVVLFNGQCKRRAMEQNQGEGIDSQQWLEMMKYFDWKCAYSGEPLGKDTRSIDHVNPLNRGGENEIWNVVPMYRNYNSSKRDKPMLDWYKEQEFYDEERLQKIYEWQKYAYEKWGTA